MFNVDMQVAAMALAGIGGLLLLIFARLYCLFYTGKIKKIRNEVYLFYAG